MVGPICAVGPFVSDDRISEVDSILSARVIPMLCCDCSQYYFIMHFIPLLTTNIDFMRNVMKNGIQLIKSLNTTRPISRLVQYLQIRIEVEAEPGHSCIHVLNCEGPVV